MLFGGKHGHVLGIFLWARDSTNDDFYYWIIDFQHESGDDLSVLIACRSRWNLDTKAGNGFDNDSSSAGHVIASRDNDRRPSISEFVPDKLRCNSGRSSQL